MVHTILDCRTTALGAHIERCSKADLESIPAIPAGTGIA